MQARVRENVNQQEKYKKQLRNQKVKFRLTGGKSDAKSNNKPLVTADTYDDGNWVKGDREMDDRIQTLREYMQLGEPLGKLYLDMQTLEALKKKKEQEQAAYADRLAYYLVDPKRPETQDLLRSSWPHLFDGPDKLHQKAVAMMKKLRYLLRDGIIKGPEYHQFILQLCAVDTFLPLFPLWDPNGVILTGSLSNLVVGDLSRKVQNQADVKQRGIFNPIRYGYASDVRFDSTTKENIQKAVKRAIIRRLYPRMRDNADSVIDSTFLSKKSFLTDSSGNFKDIDNTLSSMLPAPISGTISSTTYTL
jgi:hypothetical protein